MLGYKGPGSERSHLLWIQAREAPTGAAARLWPSGWLVMALSLRESELGLSPGRRAQVVRISIGRAASAGQLNNRTGNY